MSMGVYSEIGQLHKVLVHRPGREHTRITPSNLKQYNVDDVRSKEKLEVQHNLFLSLLSSMGAEPILLRDLLTQTLDIPIARKELLERHFTANGFGPRLRDQLYEYMQEQPSKIIAAYFLEGMLFSELPFNATGFPVLTMQDDDVLLPPMTAQVFTRDTSCWIGTGVSINPMMHPARKREAINLDVIYRYHPMFKKNSFQIYSDMPETNHERVTLEGGDIAVITADTVMIGMSERTTAQAIEILAHKLFGVGEIKKIIAVEIPRKHATMHLDTVFTQLDIGTFTAFPMVINRNTRCWIITPENVNEGSLYNTLEVALHVDTLKIIPTGGDKYEAEREQWNDANNLLAVKPGTVIGYARNIYTNELLDKAGINILTLEGDELGKGRGGPRCMTCPMERDKV